MNEGLLNGIARVIPSLAPFVGALDSSSLILVLDNDEKKRTLVARLQRSPATYLYVPTLSLDEAFDVDDATLKRRLRTLGEIYKSAQGRVLVAGGLDSAMVAEIKEWQPTLVESDFQVAGLVGADRNTLRKLGDHCREIARQAGAGKDFGFLKDRAGADDFAKAFGYSLDATAAADLIEQSRPLAPLYFAVHPAVLLGAGRVTEEQLVASPRRYPVTNVFGHFACRQMIANAVPHNAGHSVLGIFRTKTKKKGGRGAWYDSGIAAISALADVLISEDADLRVRCNWLASRSLLHFRTITLADFLS